MGRHIRWNSARHSRIARCKRRARSVGKVIEREEKPRRQAGLFPCKCVAGAASPTSLPLPEHLPQGVRQLSNNHAEVPTRILCFGDCILRLIQAVGTIARNAVSQMDFGAGH